MDNFVVFKLEPDGTWDRLSVNLALDKAKGFRDACRSTYEGCKFMIVEIIEED